MFSKNVIHVHVHTLGVRETVLQSNKNYDGYINKG